MKNEKTCIGQRPKGAYSRQREQEKELSVFERDKDVADSDEQKGSVSKTSSQR